MAGDTTLGDFAPFNYGKGLPERSRVPGPVPVFGSNGVVGFHSKALTSGPTIIIGRKGTVGAVHLSLEPCWPIDTTFYVERERIDDARFTYYLLTTVGLEHMNADSAVPGLNRDAAHARNIQVPSLEQQREIARVLGDMDDKIGLNKRMNRVLEAMARAIFKAWFIDFEPVKAKAAGATSFRGMPQPVFDQLADKLVETELGPIPEGWPIVSVAEIADYVNGKAFTKHATGQGRMIIRIAELNSGPGGATKYSEVETEPQYTAFPDDILFAWSGSLGVYRWHRDEAIINQHIFKVIPKDRPKWYVYYRLVQAMPFFQAIASTKATTMGHIKRGHLSDAVFAEPPISVIEAADEHIRPLYDLIHCNERQSFALAAIRDTLLPKLISGELRVDGGE